MGFVPFALEPAFFEKVSYARGSSITITWPRTRCVEAYETALRASPVPWLQVVQGLARSPASIWGWPGFVVGFRFVYIPCVSLRGCVTCFFFSFLTKQFLCVFLWVRLALPLLSEQVA